MDIKKVILYFILTILIIVLFDAWQRDYSLGQVKHLNPLVKKCSADINNHPTAYIPLNFIPRVAERAKKAKKIPLINEVQEKRLITVQTDVLEIKIDPKVGSIVSAKLLKYNSSLGGENIPIQILSRESSKLYIAQSGLIKETGELMPVQFQSNKKLYILGNNKNKLIVLLRGRTTNGILITKIYTFHRDDYAIRLAYKLQNNTTQLWKGSIYTQITRRQPLVDHKHFYVRSYNGAAIGSPQMPYKKLSYDSLSKKNLDYVGEYGWIAMQQHYFLTAWVPENHKLAYHYYSHVMQTFDEPHIYVIGFVSPQLHLAIGSTAFIHLTLYVGPEIAERLKILSPELERTINYGWLWPISMLLFWIMNVVHDLVRNWGWSIIITTILIKFMFYWFSAKSFRSMACMREIQPRLQALKERYGDDRQALSRMTVELYRKEKINPLGGCLPMLIQIPVFIAFYYVIIESVELHQAPFILWIHDLSAKDPYYILPILMGGSMLVQQWLSPTSSNAAQKKMMWILPIIFTVFFINFPAGLALYWITNNMVQASQQWYIGKTYESYKAKLKVRHAKK